MEGFSKYHFKDVGENEQIVKVLHRNWFYLLQQFFLVIVTVGVFVGALVFLPLFFPDITNGADQSIIVFAQNFFMLAVWIYAWLIWIDYYFDVWIITTERVVNIEQKGLFTRHVSELRFNKIEDVTTEVTGFLPTILNYGDVKIQTAAEEAEFRFRTVSDPYHVKNIIMELQRKNEKESTDELGEMIKEKISGE